MKVLIEGVKLVKKRVGLITWHYYSNFGSALQAYALQETISNMGYKAVIINYRNPKFGRLNKAKELAKIVVQRLSCNNFFTHYRFFQDKYFKQTRLIQDVEKMPRLSKKFDAFVCGSDQIWAPNVFNPVYMLDFVSGDKKKISYAASIGLNELPQKYIEKYTCLLADFDAVSVREDAGGELLSDKCGITAQTVLDPTFLVAVDRWIELENAVTVTNKKYVFCYFLNAEHHYSDLVKEYAEKNEYEIIGVSANKNDVAWMKFVNAGPCEFLWLIHNAEAVFTDSYHGTIFSLLYHKKFVLFERFESNDPICQNSRIYQLDKYFELNKIILKVPKNEKIEIEELDYCKFENKLKALREKSLYFLRNALER